MRAQALRARLGAHPGNDFVQQERDEEHPLGSSRWAIETIASRGLPSGVYSSRSMSSGSPSHPSREARRREQIVERASRGSKRSLRGKERLEIEARRRWSNGGSWISMDQVGEVELAARRARRVEQDRGKQDVLAAAERIGFDAEQREQARRCRHRRARATPRVVRAGFGARRSERVQHRERDAGAAARRVDRRRRRRLAAARSARRPGPTRRGPCARARPDAAGILVGRTSACGPLRASSIQGRKSCRHEIGKGQQQVAEVALGVDRDRGDAVDRRFLEQRDAQAGLAAAGHADATACVVRSRES